MNNIITIATKEIGVTEIPGPQHSARVLTYASEAGFSTIKDDETPWCSVFMNWVALKAGLETTNLANARSWLNVGIPVINPEPGDIVIFWREDPNSYKGHVGLFMGYSQDNSRIYTLGGNQSNMVSQSAYSAAQLLGFRRLRPVQKFTLSKVTLKNGDYGNDVTRLQDALKLLGYNPGTSDGIFGPKTENALRLFQSSYNQLNINGVFDRATREHMTKQLAAKL
ncbi:C40 family peptidase [Lacinutrix chionoecetis]